MAALDRRKRARLSRNDKREEEHPHSFFCPLTMEVMFDPVLDSEGNTYEREALLQWLKENSTSPISRRPLNERLVVPNIALREAIHEYMGSAWVADRTTASTQHATAPNASLSTTPLRATVDCYLRSVAAQLDGLDLMLNKEGCCAFLFHGVTFVLDVPEDAGMFCFYTRNLLPKDVERESRDLISERALELNFLQSCTRGGCLSSQIIDTDSSELVFSYTDRIMEVSSSDFANILLNFVDTALRLQHQLLLHVQSKQTQNPRQQRVRLQRGSSSVSISAV